jgi:iron complex transport system substrate-binding protein
VNSGRPRSIVGIALAAMLALSSATRAQAATPPRIVSLVPSMTEDLFAIGAGPQVVGVSAFTDFPARARNLPVVASFVSLDAERVLRLHPDVVVGIPAQRRLVADLQRSGVHVELLTDDSFHDLFATLARLGRLSGHEREARALADRLHARTASLVATVPAGARPRVLVVLDASPLYTVGDRSYIAHLIALAGGRNAVGTSDPYPRIGAEAIVAAQPDAIVSDAQSGLRAVLDTEPWRSLRCVRAGRVYLLDDPDILQRPGPRYNEGLAWLIAHLHPQHALTP